MQVVVVNGASVDGRIAIDPAVPSWLDRRWKGVLAGGTEGAPDVFAEFSTNIHLEGSSSFVGRAAEERFARHQGRPTELHGDFLPHDPSTDMRRMAVPDSGGRVDWRLPKESDNAYVVVLVTHSTPPEYLAELRAKQIGYLLAGDGRVDLRLACERLGDLFGVDTIISTAGGVLNGVLLRLGLVTEIWLGLHPTIVGLPDAPAIFEGYGLDGAGDGDVDGDGPVPLELISVDAGPEGVVHLRYRVRNP